MRYALVVFWVAYRDPGRAHAHFLGRLDLCGGDVPAGVKRNDLGGMA